MLVRCAHNVDVLCAEICTRPPQFPAKHGCACLHSQIGAIVLTSGDLMTNTLRFLWAVEGRRQDLAIIDQHLLTAVWFTRTQVHFLSVCMHCIVIAHMPADGRCGLHGRT